MERILLSNGWHVLQENDKLIIVEDCFDEEDLHYFAKKPKKLLANSEVTYIKEFTNFYGSYVTVEFENIRYDVKKNNVKKM